MLADLRRFLALDEDAEWDYICQQIVDPARASKKRTLDHFAFPDHVLDRTRGLLVELGYAEHGAGAGGAGSDGNV